MFIGYTNVFDNAAVKVTDFHLKNLMDVALIGNVAKNDFLYYDGIKWTNRDDLNGIEIGNVEIQVGNLLGRTTTQGDMFLRLQTGPAGANRWVASPDLNGMYFGSGKLDVNTNLAGTPQFLRYDRATDKWTSSSDLNGMNLAGKTLQVPNEIPASDPTFAMLAYNKVSDKWQKKYDLHDLCISSSTVLTDQVYLDVIGIRNNKTVFFKYDDDDPAYGYPAPSTKRAMKISTELSGLCIGTKPIANTIIPVAVTADDPAMLICDGTVWKHKQDLHGMKLGNCKIFVPDLLDNTADGYLKFQTSNNSWVRNDDINALKLGGKPINIDPTSLMNAATFDLGVALLTYRAGNGYWSTQAHLSGLPLITSPSGTSIFLNALHVLPGSWFLKFDPTSQMLSTDTGKKYQIMSPSDELNGLRIGNKPITIPGGSIPTTGAAAVTADDPAMLICDGTVWKHKQDLTGMKLGNSKIAVPDLPDNTTDGYLKFQTSNNTWIRNDDINLLKLGGKKIQIDPTSLQNEATFDLGVCLLSYRASNGTWETQHHLTGLPLISNPNGTSIWINAVNSLAGSWFLKFDPTSIVLQSDHGKHYQLMNASNDLHGLCIGGKTITIPSIPTTGAAAVTVDDPAMLICDGTVWKHKQDLTGMKLGNSKIAVPDLPDNTTDGYLKFQTSNNTWVRNDDINLLKLGGKKVQIDPTSLDNAATFDLGVCLLSYRASNGTWSTQHHLTGLPLISNPNGTSIWINAVNSLDGSWFLKFDPTSLVLNSERGKPYQLMNASNELQGLRIGGKPITIVGGSIPTTGAAAVTADDPAMLICDGNVWKHKQDLTGMKLGNSKINVSDLPDNTVDSYLKFQTSNNTWVRNDDINALKLGGKKIQIDPTSLDTAATFDLGVCLLSYRASNGYWSTQHHLSGLPLISNPNGTSIWINATTSIGSSWFLKFDPNSQLLTTDNGKKYQLMSPSSELHGLRLGSKPVVVPDIINYNETSEVEENRFSFMAYDRGYVVSDDPAVTTDIKNSRGGWGKRNTLDGLLLAGKPIWAGSITDTWQNGVEFGLLAYEKNADNPWTMDPTVKGVWKAKNDLSGLDLGGGKLNVSTASLHKGDVLSYDGTQWISKPAIAATIISINGNSNTTLIDPNMNGVIYDVFNLTAIHTQGLVTPTYPSGRFWIINSSTKQLNIEMNGVSVELDPNEIYLYVKFKNVVRFNGKIGWSELPL